MEEVRAFKAKVKKQKAKGKRRGKGTFAFYLQPFAFLHPSIGSIVDDIDPLHPAIISSLPNA